jgi:hypothetical protein
LFLVKPAMAELVCRLLYLPVELLVIVANRLAEDDELAASLACRKGGRGQRSS